MDDKRVKKLIHRANYRGIKEADLILGGFAKAHARALTESEIDQFEALLEEKDHDIYGWITGAIDIPTEFNTAVFQKIRDFVPNI